MVAAGAPKKKGVKDLRNGALLQMAEAATLGLPLEVWKTRMGRFRGEGTLTAFRNVYASGGGGLPGVRAFWAGFTPKMIESGTKGAVLMVAKEGLKDVCDKAGIDPFLGAILAGAGGGAAQTVVISPMTFLVTAAVTGGDGRSVTEVVRQTYGAKGVKGFYPGGSAVALRQASNWASRQGFTEGFRISWRKRVYGSKDAQLTPNEELICGVLGGAASCWNHPLEVCRIEMQSRANTGQTHMSMGGVLRMVVAEHGLPGLFKGVVPRLMLGIWQAVFMVSLPHIIGAAPKKH